MSKQTNVLIHLHLYYHEQIDWIISKLKNICDCNWDLYVTFCKDNSTSRKKILKLKPNTQFIKVENQGYDILPFIKVLKMVNLNNYDSILKIHTKNYRQTPHYFGEANITVQGFSWRDDLINVLLGSKKIFKKNLESINKKEIGMIFSENFNFPLKNRLEDTVLLEEIKKELGIKNNYQYYCAGTMFLIRAEILNPLKNLEIKNEWFTSYNATGSNGNFAHSFERIFTIMTMEAEQSIKLIKNKEKKNFKEFFKNIFSVKNEGIHKVITILGLKLKIKSQKLIAKLK